MIYRDLIPAGYVTKGGTYGRTAFRITPEGRQNFIDTCFNIGYELCYDYDGYSTCKIIYKDKCIPHVLFDISADSEKAILDALMRC
ncbi:hypothetical protein [Ruminococcus sp.]|uniref:hypothetical protein n=1 Tax=Ruminococcus sp. TaxID=41978 RepID=UPI0025F8D122|nr:hypothetical protein [Ruminococcus sp.]MBQ8965897.1 hypothetical protein [Ruminococcus sp.]